MDKTDACVISMTDVCPALNEYYRNHTEHNLKKLCLNMQEFFISVYSTLETNEEKDMLFESIKRIHELCKNA